MLFSLLAAGYLLVGWRAWREPELPVVWNGQDLAFIRQGVQVQQAAVADSERRESSSRAVPVARGPLDINTADSVALLDLPGIGPTKVAAILRYRRQQGRFSSLDDLLKVKGIGPATLKRMRNSLKPLGSDAAGKAKGKDLDLKRRHPAPGS